MSDGDVLVTASWNIEHSGIDADGRDDRWEQAMDVLSGIRPHVFFRQEATDPARDGGRRLHAEADRLKLLPLPATATPESPNTTVVMIDPDVFAVDAHHVHTTRMWHPITNPVVRVRGIRQPLGLASVHLCSYDPAARATEARRLTVMGDHGRHALFAGDMNSYVHRPDDETHPLPVWTRIADPVHYQHRTIERNGVRVNDDEPDRILAGRPPGANSIFTELGHHAATQLGQHDALTPTATLWRKDQGTPQRIDRFYGTRPFADALLDFTVRDDDEVRQVSDHALVIATFSLPILRHSLANPTDRTQ
ncbi:endonuclease/exonuclease/phosphatase family protein [Streptomyces sp. NPDC049881]|uniref:endonuclease/exonuclease/phosphatase family protein n=1 Tax=Streptomyces sp. NPDC049881 TaxID=3155778 RepID=UPI00343F5D8A